MRPNNGGNNNFNRRPNRNHNGGGQNRNHTGGGNTMRRSQQPQNLRNQIFDSHGPNGERVRGNAFQVHEKYQSLARDAEERVDQEAYGQFAEHYYRIVEAIQEMEAERSARFTPQGQPQQSQDQNDQPEFGASELAGESEAEQPRRGYQPQPSQPYQNQRDQSQREQPRRNHQSGYQDQNREQDQGQRPDQRQDQGQRRELGRELGQEPSRDQQRDSARDGRRQFVQTDEQPRGRRPLEPIDQDDDAADSSGPIFSLADDQQAAPVRSARSERPERQSDKRPAQRVDLDIAPDGATDVAKSDAAKSDAAEAPPAPRRRGRPPKAESAE